MRTRPPATHFAAVLAIAYALAFIGDLVNPPFALDDEGYLAIPGGRGLGIAFNHEDVRRHTGLVPNPVL